MSSRPEAEPVSSCSVCGASIYPEHIDRGIAGRIAGQLLCHHCLEERHNRESPPVPAGDELTLSLAETPDGTDKSGRSSIHGFSGHSPAEGMARESETFQRPLNPAGRGATRARTFHCRLSEGAMHHLDQQVNAWLDHNTDVEVKFATTTVGVWEGKHAEPNLILTVFY